MQRNEDALEEAELILSTQAGTFVRTLPLDTLVAALKRHVLETMSTGVRVEWTDAVLTSDGKALNETKTLRESNIIPSATICLEVGRPKRYSLPYAYHCTVLAKHVPPLADVCGI